MTLLLASVLFSYNTSAQGCGAGTGTDIDIIVAGGYSCAVAVHVNYTLGGAVYTEDCSSGSVPNGAIMHIPAGSTINYVDVNGHQATHPASEYPDPCGSPCGGGPGNCITLDLNTTPATCTINVD